MNLGYLLSIKRISLVYLFVLRETTSRVSVGKQTEPRKKSPLNPVGGVAPCSTINGVRRLYTYINLYIYMPVFAIQIDRCHRNRMAAAKLIFGRLRRRSN